MGPKQILRTMTVVKSLVCNIPVPVRLEILKFMRLAAWPSKSRHVGWRLQILRYRFRSCNGLLTNASIAREHRSYLRFANQEPCIYPRLHDSYDLINSSMHYFITRANQSSSMVWWVIYGGWGVGPTLWGRSLALSSAISVSGTGGSDSPARTKAWQPSGGHGMHGNKHLPTKGVSPWKLFVCWCMGTTHVTCVMKGSWKI